MEESKGWELQRYVTLFVVLVLHAGLLVVLVLASLAGPMPGTSAHPVELLLLAPPSVPAIRSETPRPKRLSGGTTIQVAPPVLESPSPTAPASASAGPASASEGNGSAVDWLAEAHRAVQAFDIRNHQPRNDMLLSGSPAEDHWWPRSRHHAGDQFKTANGDWIVWINSSCYQVANSASTTSALATRLTRTVCPDESSPPRARTPDQARAAPKQPGNQ